MSSEAKKKIRAVAAKVQDVPNGRFWIAMSYNQAANGVEVRTLILECERFYDARCAAQMLLSRSEVAVRPLENMHVFRKRATFHQIRWRGNPGDQHLIARSRVGGRIRGSWFRL